MKNKIFNTLGHKLQWLVLLVALLGTSQGVWGENFQYPVIYVASTSNSEVKLHLWRSSDSSHPCYAWESDPTMTYIEEKGGLHYFEYEPGDCVFDRVIVRQDGGQSSDLSVESNKNLYNKSDSQWYFYCPSGPSNEIVEILDGGKVCFYAGVNSGWTPNTVYLNNNSSDVVSNPSKSFVTVGGTSYNLAAVCLPEGEYYISNQTKSSWGGVIMGETSEAGKIYGLTKNGSDVVTINTGITPGALKFDNSSGETSKTVSVGADITLYAASNTSEDPYENALEVQYYSKDAEGCYLLLGSGDMSDNSNTKTVSLSSLSAGTYTLYALLTDKTNHNVYIKESNTISLTITSCTYPSELTNVYANEVSPLTVCSGNDVVITATGAESGYDYILGEETKTSNQGNLTYTKLNPTTSTTYTIYAKQTGSSCATQSKGSVSVTVNSAPTVSAITTSGYVCEGVSKNLSVTASNATGYQWYLGDSPISGANSNSYSISSMSATGTYKCVVSNGYGCGTTTSSTTTQTLAPKPHNAVIADAAATCKGNTNAQYTASVDNDYTNASTLSWTWAVVSGSGWNVTSSNTNPGVFTAGSENGRIRATPTLTTGGQACAGTAAEKDVAVANKSITIKVENAGQISSAPYIYAWYGSNSEIVGGWPGTPMNTDAYNSGWYTYTLDVPSCSCNVVINMNSDVNKTNNLTSITADECYRITEWKRDKANYLVDCPIPCTAPTAYTVGGGGTICKYASKAITLADSQVGYTYELYKDNVATDIKAAGTGEALEIATGGIGANGTYAYTIKAFDTASSGCLTAMSGSASVVVSSSEAEEISPTYATVNNMEAVTLTSSGSVNWSITNMVGDDSYLYETTDTSTKFKGTVGNSTTGKYFHVQGKIGADGCINTAVIYVSRDEEDCN